MPPKKAADAEKKIEALRQDELGADDASAASSSEGSLDIGACSLCHCALDGADRAAFFRADREVDYSANAAANDDDDDDDPDEYYFRPDDPYLPIDLYDPHNALVYCDTCDRLYHQKCHFVPLLVVPRGQWSCLVCHSRRRGPAAPKAKKRKKKAERGGSSNSENSSTDLLFSSPPQPDAHPLELKWETKAAHLKAVEMHHQIKRVTQFCRTQLGNYRLATTAVETFTSTQRNVHHFVRPREGNGGNGAATTGTRRSSQELAQTVLKLASSKYKLRGCVLSVDAWRRGTDALRTRQRLLRLVRADGNNNGAGQGNNHQARLPADFVTRVLFPFGDALPIRTVPRTEEVGEPDPIEGRGGDNNCQALIPSEVVVTNSRKGGSSQPGHHGKHEKKSNSSAKGGLAIATKKSAADDGNDPDEGVSIDDLTCCLCWQSTATDDNDLVMCDGSGCARAYHMQCLHPHLTIEDLEQDDWFCPICTCLADLMHLVQSETLGDEWEVRRREQAARRLPCDGSLKSWDGPEEVFPESDWEYETAQRLVKNQHDADTNRLLAQVLGIDVTGEVNSDLAPEDDSDDDEHFDPVAFENEKQSHRGRRDGDSGSGSDASTSSSQASLDEMSSVELGIGRDELAALSDNDDDDSNDDDGDSTGAGARRKSRRLAKKHDDSTSSESDARRDDPGRLDEGNILPGKRNRKPVDYRRLNDALFGDLPEEENATLDAGEDYFERATAASSSGKRSSSTSASSSTPQDGENSESDEESAKSRPPSQRSSGEAGRLKSRSATGSAKGAQRPKAARSTNAKTERSKKPKEEPGARSPPLTSRRRDTASSARRGTGNGTKRGQAPTRRPAAANKPAPARATSTPHKNGTKRKRGPSTSRS